MSQFASVGIEPQGLPADHVPLSAGYEVVCVCGGFGFPNGGTGTTGRLKNFGRALLRTGMSFRLLHCGPSPVAANTEKSGVFEGIRYEYTTSLRRPSRFVARAIVYMRALTVLTIRLVQLRPARRRTVVCLFTLSGPLTLYVGWVCRLLGLSMVQELSEWWPGATQCGRFDRWLYHKALWKNATGGVVVISKEIERRVRDAAIANNLRTPIYWFPMVVDTREFNGLSKRTNRSAAEDSFFLWCGAADSWNKDVKFLIRATGRVRAAGFRCKLVIVGSCSENWRAIFMAHAREHGLSDDELVITGFVDDPTLEKLYHTATALLLPLPDDDRSRTRIPNKLGEYLSTGTPVVSCKIGDLVEFLSNGENAYLAEPSNEEDFAEKMISIVRDPATAIRIGAAGQKTCENYLDYRVHARALAQFFLECCGS